MSSCPYSGGRSRPHTRWPRSTGSPSGRLTVGVGAGFPGTFGRPLHTLSEVPWARRFARLDETVTLWRQIWKADGHTSFHGELLHFDDIPPSIGPYRPGGPPLWLGGATPAALASTGRHYDGWFPYPPDPHDYRTGLADLRRTAVEAGRDPGTITPALFVNVRTADSIESCRRSLDEFARVNYGLPLEDLEKIQAVAAGTAAQLADRLTPYIEAGCPRPDPPPRRTHSPRATRTAGTARRPPPAPPSCLIRGPGPAVRATARPHPKTSVTAPSVSPCSWRRPGTRG
ncbi:LLM class flavin-dependent oxidoreductase [Streptomyces lasalocidi]